MRRGLFTEGTRGYSFLEERRRPSSRFYFFRTHTGVEIDLSIDRAANVSVSSSNRGVATDLKDWKHLQYGIMRELSIAAA